MLVFWQTLTPFSATDQRRRRKRRRGRRQELAVYAASYPLTNSPCALWHRQSCWLCYCWLLTTRPEQQVGPVCLEGDTQKTGDFSGAPAYKLFFQLSWLRQAPTVPVMAPLPAAISSSAYSSNTWTRLIASVRDDKCPEIAHCNQIISSS